MVLGDLDLGFFSEEKTPFYRCVHLGVFLRCMESTLPFSYVALFHLGYLLKKSNSLLLPYLSGYKTGFLSL